MIKYFVRVDAVLYNSEKGGWWRYFGPFTDLKEANHVFEHKCNTAASRVELVKEMPEPRNGEWEHIVIKKNRVIIGAR